MTLSWLKSDDEACHCASDRNAPSFLQNLAVSCVNMQLAIHEQHARKLAEPNKVLCFLL